MNLEFRPSVELNFNGFKQMCKEFVDALPTLDECERNTRFKRLSLAYLGGDFTEIEQAQAAYAFEIVSREFLRYECGDPRVVPVH